MPWWPPVLHGSGTPEDGAPRPLSGHPGGCVGIHRKFLLSEHGNECIMGRLCAKSAGFRCAPSIKEVRSITSNKNIGSAVILKRSVVYSFNPKMRMMVFTGARFI